MTPLALLVRPDCSKAAAYGDFDKLQQFITQDAASVNQPDSKGYFPLQWAGASHDGACHPPHDERPAPDVPTPLGRGQLLLAATPAAPSCHWAGPAD